MDKTNLISTLNTAKANLNNAESTLNYQTANYKRYKELYDKGLVSADEYENALLTYKQAKEQVISAKESVQTAQTNLGYATITAPIDGVILGKAVEEGQTVAASYNTPELFTVAKDLKDMQVVADVDEADIGNVTEGARVTFTVDAFPNDTFSGTVTQVRQEATETDNVVTYEVVISARNDDLKLKPGLTANVTIYTTEMQGVLSVSNKALRFTPVKETVGNKKIVDCNGTSKVWTLEGDKLVAHAVKIGMTDGTHTQIISGIKEGQTIITELEVTTEGGEGMAPQEGGERSPFAPGPPDKRTRRSKAMETNEKKVVIELQNVTREFLVGDEVVHALRGVSFKIHEGEFVTIMGKSGSGKSTLLNQLGCLDTPTKGEYYLDGISVRKMSKSQRAVLRNRKIGFIFQNYNLLPKTTSVENVELPLMYNPAISSKERTRRAIDALEAVGLGERLYHKSNQMSGGQMQRVAIARALVNNPAVILADEATGNLDTRTSFEILVLFQKLHAEGRTIIFVTHNPDIAKYSSRNIQLRDGKVISDEYNTNILSAAKGLAALPVNTDE